MAVAYKVEELLALRGTASESAVSAERFGDEEAIIGKSRIFPVSLESWVFFSLPPPSHHSRFSRQLSNSQTSHHHTLFIPNQSLSSILTAGTPFLTLLLSLVYTRITFKP